MSRILDRVISMLATESTEKLKMLITKNQAGEYLQAEYLSTNWQDEDIEAQLRPDTQEAADAANDRIEKWNHAEEKWAKLPRERQNELIIQLQRVDPTLEEAELRLLDRDNDEWRSFR